MYSDYSISHPRSKNKLAMRCPIVTNKERSVSDVLNEWSERKSRLEKPRPGVTDPRGDEGRGDRRVGLSKAHISPRVKIYKDGSLIKCAKNVSQIPVGGGRRGSVKTFSRGSRLRMKYTLGKVKRSAIPLFCTFTYPDGFPVDFDIWARHIDLLRKRLARRGWGAGWRKEFKKRKSGVNAGKVAPHFHLLIWGAKYAEVLFWANKAWYEIVGSEDIRHKNAGTRIETIRSKRGAVGYVGKYVTKEEQQDIDAFMEENEVNSLGRMWGLINADKIPWSDCEEIELDVPEANYLMRLMRRYMKMKKRKGLPAVNMLCNDPAFWLDRLDRLIRPD